MNADGMPVPLEEEILVEDFETAKIELEEKAKQYHEVEGNALTLDLFDTPYYPRKVLHHMRMQAEEK